jgi:hypothetical protein
MHAACELRIWRNSAKGFLAISINSARVQFPVHELFEMEHVKVNVQKQNRIPDLVYSGIISDSSGEL